MKLPCLGSVKLGCTLPRGICYEASIRRENGRWYICLKLWRPPEPKPERAPDRHGHQPPGHRLRRSGLPESQSITVRRWQRAQAVGGSPRKIDKCQSGGSGAFGRQHQMTSTVTRKFSGHRGPERGRIDAGESPRAQADAGMGDIKRQLIYKGPATPR